MNTDYYKTIITNNKQDYDGIIKYTMSVYNLPSNTLGESVAIELLARMYNEKHNG